MWNLRNRLLVPILFVTVFGLGIAGISSYYMAKNALEDATRLDAMGSVKGLTDVLTIMFRAATSDVEQLANTLQARDVLNNLGDSGKIPPFLSILGAMSKSKPYYQLGIILDKQGAVVACTPGPAGDSVMAARAVGQSRADRDYYKEAIQGKTAISKPILSRTTYESIVIICTPVYQDENIIG